MSQNTSELHLDNICSFGQKRYMLSSLGVLGLHL